MPIASPAPLLFFGSGTGLMLKSFGIASQRLCHQHGSSLHFTSTATFLLQTSYVVYICNGGVDKAPRRKTLKHHHNCVNVETLTLVTDATRSMQQLPYTFCSSSCWPVCSSLNVPKRKLYRILVTRKPKGIRCNAAVTFCGLISLERFFANFDSLFQ